MAVFMAKQLVGNKLESVKGALSSDKDATDSTPGGKRDMDPEVAAAMREAEEQRQEKHRKMEEEREQFRQGIREKYNLSRVDDAGNEANSSFGKNGRPMTSGPATEEETDSILNIFPNSVKDLANKISDESSKLIADASNTCALM